MFKNIFFNLIFIVAGIGMLIASGVVTVNQYNFIQHSQKSSGLVIDNILSGGKSRSYHPVVKFKTPEGTDVQFTSSVGTNPAEFHIGQAVDILYDPLNPQKAQTNSVVDLWMGSVLTAILGTAFVLAGIFSTIAVLKKKAREIVEKKRSN